MKTSYRLNLRCQLVRQLTFRCRVPILLILFLAAPISAEAGAQAVPVQAGVAKTADSLPVPLGTRVRLFLDPRLHQKDDASSAHRALHVGIFAGLDSGTVFLQQSATRPPDRFSREWIVTFERSHGRRPSRRTIQWAASAGGVVGFPLGYQLGRELSGLCSSAECQARSTASQVPFFILGGVVGAAIGAGIGAGSVVLVQALRGERWEAVPLER